MMVGGQSELKSLTGRVACGRGRGAAGGAWSRAMALLMSLAVCLTLSASLQDVARAEEEEPVKAMPDKAPEAAAAPAATSAAAAAAYEELTRIAEMAPARQVGQPGNDAVDALVLDRFTRAVERHTDAAKRAEAEALLVRAQKAEDDLTAVRNEQNQGAADAKANASPWYIRVTIDEPWSLVALLVLIAGANFTAGHLQKRKAAWIVGGVFLLLAPALVAVSMTVDTPAKKFAREKKVSTAGEVFEKEMMDASLIAWEADRKVASALEGQWQSGRVWHNTAAFIPGKANLSISGGASGGNSGGGQGVRLYQMAPNLVEPANLPEAGLEGPLVYGGTATPRELAGRHFENAIVLLEFASGTRWLDAVQLGAKAVVVLDPPAGVEATFTEAAQKTVMAPLSVPRFLARRTDLVAALGKDWETLLKGTPTVKLTQEVTGRWERRRVASDWIFIPGTASPSKPDAKGKVEIDRDLGRQTVVILAAKDTTGIVPEITPGVTGAANLAMLLKLLEGFEKQPPKRPVILAAVNDHSNALRGEQELAWALFSEPGAAAAELTWIESELAQQRFLAEVYGKPPTSETIEEMRTGESVVGGKLVRQKEQAVDRLTQTRNLRRDERNRLQFRLEDDDRRKRKGQPVRLTAQARAEAEGKLKSLQHEAEELTKLLRLFNRFGETTRLDELPPDGLERTNKLFADIAKDAQAAVDGLEASRRQLLDNISVRRRLSFLSIPPAKEPTKSAEIFNIRYARVPATLGLALNLSFGSGSAGFFHLDDTRGGSEDQEYPPTTDTRFREFARYTIEEAEAYAKETGAPNLLTNTIRGVGGVPWPAYLGGRFAFAGRVLLQFSIPELTLATVRDSRPRDYTPDDDLDALNRANFDALTGFALGYIPRLVNAADLGASGTAINTPMPLSAQVSVRQQDQFSVTVPKTMRGNAVIAVQPLAQGSKLPNNADLYGDVRPTAVVMADARGDANIRGSSWRGGLMHVFGYDPEFRKVNAASDLTEGEKRFASKLDSGVGTPFITRTITVAEFEKIDLIGLTEPLTLAPITGMGVLDAQQDSLPRHFGQIGVPVTGLSPAKQVPNSRVGVASVFIEPGRGLKLRAGTGLVINTGTDHPQGEGFESDVGMIRNVVLTSADDLWSLTDTRLKLLQSKGVRNETASQYQKLAQEKIAEAHKAGEAGQNDRLMVSAERGRGLAYQSYTRGLSTINDLIKAVVIFLALIIPFCFFVTKLLSPWDDINRQLAMFGAVFVAMAIALRMVHPAFEVARTPEVVILAFIIMGLAGFVAVILMGRFNSSMTQAIEESQLAESVEAPQGRLAGVAFLVGVNNMKRRRIRTSLTCATVILVTFTMLSVISVGQDIEPAVVRASGEAPYSGFLFTTAGLGEIDATRIHRLRAHYQGAGMQTVARAWSQRLGTYREYLPYEIAPTQPVPGATVPALSTKVLLGLEKAEDGFLRPMPIAAGGRWFSADDAAEIALSVKAAALLGITPENMSGRELRVAGRRLKLVALLEDDVLESMRDMADAPFLPLLTQASQSAEASNAGAANTPGASLADLPGVEMARPIDIAFVPLGMARSLGDADYRMLSVKFSLDNPGLSSRKAWDEANELIQFQSARLGVGITEKLAREEGQRPIEAGQYQMTSSSSTEVGGVIKIAIPIILAGTIILNTMLGSVMERRREVAIYNAIGLNPGHVMTFFLAESLVFGMVGSVAGYLIGQVLSLAVAHFNLPLNLNYSSLSVMVVIFLTIATVLLSTVYPAMMAARAAVPSGQRRWSLPQPVGDQIFVQFPFSYDASRVLGICAYLRDYMRQNSEASTGKFLARVGPVGRVPSTAGAAGGTGNAGETAAAGGDDRAYAMIFDIAPAPFDLGVNQKMEIYAYFDPRVKAHMLAVHLTRTSGEVGNWVTVNQPFLEALRKRLLGWRSQKPATHEAYYREGERLFADAMNLPVVSPGSERV